MPKFLLIAHRASVRSCHNQGLKATYVASTRASIYLRIRS